MFQKSDFGLAQIGGAGTVALRGPVVAPAGRAIGDWRERLAQWAQDIDLVPDLGRHIGTLVWWRGVITCFGLCAIMLSTAPGLSPVPGRMPARLTSPQFDQMRAQMVAPLAFGGDSGGRMGPTDAVAPLAHAPERPRIDLDAVIGPGDRLARVLARAGVSGVDATAVLGLVSAAADPDAVPAGTRVKITLGRRTSRDRPRPLDALAMRARLDLALEITRQNGDLTIKEIPIAVDATPLRVRGTVGAGLYAAARAAGADPATIQAYLKVLSQRIDLESDLSSQDRFDFVVAHRRAATGENETGALLFAGLERDHGKDINMLRWSVDGRDQWFEASGVGERRGVFAAPVSGRLSSGFGMRFHPILGYSRMHQGVDFAAPWGTPIHAATDGRVVFAGRHGGHGNYVRIEHGGGMGSGYAHMSRIAAFAGERVRQGQVIGYVGSTGLSTGPHLHYEVYRNGVVVNPTSVKFVQTPQLSGRALLAFQAKLARLKGLPVGLQTPTFASAQPQAMRRQIALR